MASLVAVNDRFVVQRAAVLPNQCLYRLDHEFHFEADTDAVGQHFMRVSVQDRRKVAFSPFVEEVGDVRQQYFPDSLPEFPVDQVLCHIACCQRLCHPSVGIRPADGTPQLILAHEPSDFLHIHDDVHVKQPHVDAPHALRITPIAIGFQNQVKVFPIDFFPVIPCRFRAAPLIIP